MALESELEEGKKYYLNAYGSNIGTFVKTEGNNVFFTSDQNYYTKDKNGFVVFPIEKYNYKLVEDEENGR